MTVAAGQTMACVNYTIINDNIAREGNEQFRVMFSIPETARVSTPDTRSTVTIVDDDRKLVT